MYNDNILTTKAIRHRSDYLLDVQLWPLKRNVNPESWLNNFSVAEVPYAISLLENFLYFSDEILDHYFVDSFRALSQDFYLRDGPTAFWGEWSKFVTNARIIRVTGENPSDADSGYIFVRKARDLIGIPEAHLLSPTDAIALAIKTPVPIVFVDDFVGSGQQFVKQWRRVQWIPQLNRGLSFEQLARSKNGTAFYYCPIICTTIGRDEIQRECPNVVLRPTHVLDDRYSAIHKDSGVWPANQKSDSFAVLENICARAGIPNLDGDEGDWRGFNKLGLCIAFQHGVPDATLPIFTWKTNGWHPLWQKS